MEIKQTNPDSIMCKFPEIPIGGRLKLFHEKWQPITQDQLVLSTRKEGLKLEFLSKISIFRDFAQDLDILLSEVDKLLRKGAIEPDPPEKMQTGFYSIFFSCPKKIGRTEASHLQSKTFEQVSSETALQNGLLKQGHESGSFGRLGNISRSEGCISSHFSSCSAQEVHFCIQGKAYQFTRLSFSPSQAPRNFTKIGTVIAAHLRMQNLRRSVYLDVWFSVNQIREMLVSDKIKALSLLAELGFLVNMDPLSKPEYHLHRNLFSLVKGYCLTLERIMKIQFAVQRLKQEQTAPFSTSFGLMASCIEIVSHARLFMRPIQLHLLHF